MKIVDFKGTPILKSDVNVLRELELLINKELVLDDNPVVNELTGFWVENHEITSLSLNSCELNQLPDSISGLKSLKDLSIAFNPITVLPSSIGDLTSLEFLDFLGCQLESLPDSIGNLLSLIHLELGRNKLTTLPDSIGNLTSLKYFFLSHNRIENLPLSMIKLKSLHELDLSYTFAGLAFIDTLPECVKILATHGVKIEITRFQAELSKYVP